MSPKTLNLILLIAYFHTTPAISIQNSSQVLDYLDKLDEELHGQENAVFVIGQKAKTVIQTLLNHEEDYTTPEIIYNKDEKTLYIDLSQLSDIHDLTLAYLSHKLHRNIKSMKLLLVTDQQTLRKSGERAKDLENMLEYTVQLLGDVEKYASGTGIVLTKVPGEYDKHRKDHLFSAHYVHYLKELVKKFQLDNTPPNLSAHTKDLESKKIVFLQNVLHETARYPRIAILRKMGVLENKKVSIKSLVRDNLKFVDLNPFRHEFLPETKLFASKLLDRIMDDVLIREVREVCREIEKYYVLQMENVVNIQDLFEDVEQVHKRMSEIVRGGQLFFERFLDLAKDLNIDTAHVSKRISNVDFLEGLIGQGKRDLPSKYLTIVQELADDIFAKYYTFESLVKM